MNPRRSLALTAALTLAALGGAFPSAHASVPKVGKPLWTVDLRKQDGSKDWLGVSAYDAARKIAFPASDEVVVLRTSDPMTTRQPLSAPVQARAYSLAAGTGSVVGQLDFTTHLHGWVFGAGDGNLVVNTESGSALYSSGFKQVLARSEHGIEWAAPDGRVMGTWYAQQEPRHGVTEFLDARTLAPVGLRFLDESVESIAGDRIAYRADDKDGNLVVIADADDNENEVRTSCDARPDFVSEDVIVASGCGSFVVARREGTVLFSGSSSRDEVFSTASRDGRRFALCRESWSMAHWASLRGVILTVYDVERKTAIATLKVPAAPKGRDDSHPGAALSPDGTRLAVLSGGEVSLYRLP